MIEFFVLEYVFLAFQLSCLELCFTKKDFTPHANWYNIGAQYGTIPILICMTLFKITQ